MTDASVPAALRAKLHREMAVRIGPVTPTRPGLSPERGGLAVGPEEFLFETPGGVRFHYRLGEGLLAELPGPDSHDEFEIYLWGTVFGAVAWLNGFFPLHAGAIELGGRALAFTAESGGGKSTLVTALAARGFSHVCDDTLPLAAVGRAIWAIPDGKPVKLWADALALTGTSAEREIAFIPGKHFTRPSGAVGEALPLTDLFVIEGGPEVAVERVTGAQIFPLINEAIYRPQIPAALGDRRGHGEWLMRIAQGLRIWRLIRPRTEGDRAAFDRIADAIAETLRATVNAGA